MLLLETGLAGRVKASFGLSILQYYQFYCRGRSVKGIKLGSSAYLVRAYLAIIISVYSACY